MAEKKMTIEYVGDGYLHEGGQCRTPEVSVHKVGVVKKGQTFEVNAEYGARLLADPRKLFKASKGTGGAGEENPPQEENGLDAAIKSAA